MAWANAQPIARPAEQPDDALSLTAPNNEWSAGRILAHLVNAAGGYAARLEGVPRPPDVDLLASAAELAAAADRLAGFDARLRAEATEPDIRLPHADPARPLPARSTILAQALHHATEHRAQIAGALATNGNNAIHPAAIDQRQYGDTEGLGA